MDSIEQEIINDMNQSEIEGQQNRSLVSLGQQSQHSSGGGKPHKNSSVYSEADVVESPTNQSSLVFQP